jgi:dihydroneopterin aldolase
VRQVAHFPRKIEAFAEVLVSSVDYRSRFEWESSKAQFLDGEPLHQRQCRMPDHLIIEHLEFQGHCGVGQAERERPQPIAVDAELEYASGAFTHAASTGDIADAVDYAAVAARVTEIGRKQPYVLLETLGEAIMAVLFQEFPVTRAKLWIRKVVPPVSGVQGSVGVRLERARATMTFDPAPAQFLKDCLPLLPRGQALDVACGRGRNTLYLASQGFTVEAIDRDEQALAKLKAASARQGLPSITTRAMDLEDPAGPPDIPAAQYDVVLGLFYLHRPLFPVLRQALRPGGMLVYETFLIDNHLRFQHPRRREFCLEHNELLALARGLRILHYGEGARRDGAGDAPVFTARLLAARDL